MAIRTNYAGFLFRAAVNDAPPFSMCIWVKFNSLTFQGSPNTSGIAMYRGDDSTGGGAYGVRCVTAGGDLLTAFVPGGGTLAGPAVSVGVWYHVAMSRATSGTGSANYTYWVDGVSIGTVAGTATDAAGETYGTGRDVVNGPLRSDVSVRDFRAFPTAFASDAEVIAEGESDGTAVKASPYFDEGFENISSFGTFTEGNSGTATNDADNPDFDLGGGGGGGITALLPLLL